MSVSVGGHDLKHSVVDGEERDVKGSSTEIKYQNVLLSLLLVQSIRYSCCCPARREDDVILRKTSR